MSHQNERWFTRQKDKKKKPEKSARIVPHTSNARTGKITVDDGNENGNLN